MPCPNNREWEKAVNQESREELDNLMIKYGWDREIETIQITYHPRTGPIMNIYRCRAQVLSCNCDGKSSLMYVQRMPTGVIYTCQYCRKNTGGPVTFSIFDKISSRRVTIIEAFKICDEKNIMPPSGLDLAYPDRRRLQGIPRFVV